MNYFLILGYNLIWQTMQKKVIKDYNSLPESIREEIRKEYPQGFINHLISFVGKDKQLISALPHETDEISYLIKMPASLPLEEKEDEPRDPVESLPLETSLENIDEEKFLIQEEEEEESD
jgi:hypothetical protein